MNPLKLAAKRGLWKVAPGRFEPKTGREYSISIYTGPSPFELRPSPLASNPVISWKTVLDTPVTTCADPFMYRTADRWYLFFEIVSQLSWRGEIAYAHSPDGLDWKYGGIVLREPFHLSYPQVFRWKDDIFMVPETGRAGAVRLYRANPFPGRWEHAATLLDGGRFVDSSLLHFDGLWWMFTEAGPNPKEPELRLYFSDDLYGPWRQHPNSPIVTNNGTIARPSGRVIVYDGRPVRFTQPSTPVYGTEVRAFEVTALSTDEYRERQVGESPILQAEGTGWNADGMHHIDAHLLPDRSWLACVDGCRMHTPDP